MAQIESLLFLLGLSIVISYAESFVPTKTSPGYEVPSEIIIAKRKQDTDKIIEFSGPSERLPFITNFIQKGTNVFFKPQFLLSPTIIPPPTLINCNQSQLVPVLPVPHVPEHIVIEEPVKIVETTLNENKKLHENNELYENNKLDTYVNEVIEIRPVAVPSSPFYSAPPSVKIAQEPVIKIEDKPIHIPEAPILTPLPLPEMPIVVPEYNIPVEIPTAPILPVIKPEVNFVVEPDVPEYPSVPEIVIPIPEAPELPPLTVPKLPLPVIVEKPFQVPCVQPVSTISEEQSEKNHELIEILKIPVASVTKVEDKPIHIPEAPILTPLPLPEVPIAVPEFNVPVAIPAAPILPVIKPEVNFVVEPVVPEYPSVPEIVVPIPEAPELPALTVPKLPLPIIVEKPFQVPCVQPVSAISEEQSEENHELIEISKIPVGSVTKVEDKPVHIPEAPILTPLPLPEVPIAVPEFNVPVAIPAAPILPVIKPEVNFVVEPVVPEYSSVPEIVVPIPEAPELPPLTVPKLPLPVIVEKPFQVPCVQPVSAISEEQSEENHELIEISKIPVASVTKVEDKPVHIPEAPILTPLPIPEVPIAVPEFNVPVEIPAAPILPVIKPEVNFVVETVVPEYPSVPEIVVPIPEAPELPPLTVPKLPLPVIVEKPFQVPCVQPVSAISEEQSEENHELIEISKIPVGSVTKVEDKPVHIPEAPILTPLPLPGVPIAVPEFNVPVEIPAAPILPVIKPEVNFVVETVVPEYPSVPEIVVPIPEAPELPPITVPKLPHPVIVEKPFQVPCVQSVSEISQEQSEENHELIEISKIPVAPKLPPLTLPELPIPVTIQNPTLPETVVVESVETNVLPNVHEHTIIEKTPIIPAAPVIPPYVPIPVPAFVEETQHISQGSEITSQPVVEIHEYVKPSVIPEAPVLPVNPILKPPAPIFIEELPSIISQENIGTIKPVDIPTAPILPPSSDFVKESVEVPHVSKASKLLLDLLSLKKQFLSSFLSKLFVHHSSSINNKALSFPTECVQNIVAERVLPNILNEHNFKVIQNVPAIPVPSPYLQSLRHPFF